MQYSVVPYCGKIARVTFYWFKTAVPFLPLKSSTKIKLFGIENFQSANYLFLSDYGNLEKLFTGSFMIRKLFELIIFEDQILLQCFYWLIGQWYKILRRLKLPQPTVNVVIFTEECFTNKSVSITKQWNVC